MKRGTFGETSACKYLEDIIDKSPDRNRISRRIKKYEALMAEIYKSNLGREIKLLIYQLMIEKFLMKNDTVEKTLANNIMKVKHRKYTKEII